MTARVARICQLRTVQHIRTARSEDHLGGFSCRSNSGTLSPVPTEAGHPGSDFTAVIGPKDHVKVVQIIHNPNHIAVKIRLSDGREGWVFSGESIEVYEPGCRGADFRAC